MRISKIGSIRKCPECGKMFPGNGDSRLCPECVRESRKQGVIRDRICVDCGASFPGGPRAKRCPECRIIARRENSKNFKREGPRRPLGSTDTCLLCGKEYIVEGGRQKYCRSCRRDGTLLWQRKHKKEYNKRPEQIKAKRQSREERQKVCKYCLRVFWSNVSSNYCSDYCRKQQERIRYCKCDIARGINRNMQKLIDEREDYREKVKNMPVIQKQGGRENG